MIKKGLIILFILLLPFVNVSALENTNIEIFHINKGCVIQRVESNPTIQSEVENYLKGISGILVKFNPIPDKGYVINIPFENPVRVENQWLNAFVDEVFIIFPEQDRPYLMVSDNKDRTLFLSFQGNIDLLLKNINFHPQSIQ